jgi:SHS2 domain-containing protein
MMMLCATAEASSGLGGKMERGYRIFDHTADVGLEAWGATPAEAFAEAARGMFTIILGVDPRVWRHAGSASPLAVEVSGAAWEELLVNWLAELLFLFEVDGVVPITISVTHCEPPACAAEVEGVSMSERDELRGVGVKAVTYHELRVAVDAERTGVRVIFDI